MVYAVIRAPKLCDMFHKAERKKYREEQIAKNEEEAFLHLRQEKVSELNSQAFIDNLVQQISNLLKKNTKPVSPTSLS